MKTLPLSSGISHGTWETPTDRSERATLVGEISERLIEWRQIDGPKRVHSWLSRLATLGGDAESKDALWLYLRMSTGDLSQLTASFTELGAQSHCTKQAKQQEHERALRVIARHFPELARELQQLTRHFAGLDTDRAI